MSLLSVLRNGRPGRATAAAAITAAAFVVLALPAAALGWFPAVPPPPAAPTSADQIQNVDQVKTAIKAYYGDTVTADVDPVPNAIDGGDKALHTFSPTGAYVQEMAGIVAGAEKYLRAHDGWPWGDHHVHNGTRAVVFDIDDTTLTTYNYEIYSNWVYNPTTNAAFVNAAIFPAAPGMVGLEKYAESHGYQVFFLTGRPVTQHDGTLANLQGVGYDVVDGQLYLKDNAAAWLSSCAPACTTIQYKSLTRQHIESLGFDIIANFGDQYSDLTGGFADRTFKIPNPNYFLP